MKPNKLMLKMILIAVLGTSVLLTGCSRRKRLKVVVPSASTEVKIRDAYVLPLDHVKAGEEATLIVDYLLMAPPDVHEVDVEETMVLTKDGNLEKLLYEGSIKRIVGKVIAKVRFLVPKTARGSYVIKNTVKTRAGYDAYDALFEVSNNRGSKKRHKANKAHD